MTRLEQIEKAMLELAGCQEQFTSAHDPLLPLLGQMDWLEELHRLLHEEVS